MANKHNCKAGVLANLTAQSLIMLRDVIFCICDALDKQFYLDFEFSKSLECLAIQIVADFILLGIFVFIY
jgi:hypothetical protein